MLPLRQKENCCGCCCCCHHCTFQIETHREEQFYNRLLNNSDLSCFVRAGRHFKCHFWLNKNQRHGSWRPGSHAVDNSTISTTTTTTATDVNATGASQGFDNADKGGRGNTGSSIRKNIHRTATCDMVQDCGKVGSGVGGGIIDIGINGSVIGDHN